MGLDVAYLKVEGMSTTSGLVSGTAVTPDAATNATTFLESVGRPGHLDGSASASIATSIPDRLIMDV